MELAESRQSGPHARLVEMVGEWQGTSSLWFRPGDPGRTDELTMHIEPIAGGATLRVTYETAIDGEPATGEMLIGYHLDEERWQAAWTDSFHTGTQLMWLEGSAWERGSEPMLRGRYPAGDTHWGWRLTFRIEDQELVIVHDNVPPGMDPIRALVWRCSRVPG